MKIITLFFASLMMSTCTRGVYTYTDYYDVQPHSSLEIRNTYSDVTPIMVRNDSSTKLILKNSDTSQVINVKDTVTIVTNLKADKVSIINQSDDMAKVWFRIKNCTGNIKISQKGL